MPAGTRRQTAGDNDVFTGFMMRAERKGLRNKALKTHEKDYHYHVMGARIIGKNRDQRGKLPSKQRPIQSTGKSEYLQSAG
jgi:hypothetical protein